MKKIRWFIFPILPIPVTDIINQLLYFATWVPDRGISVQIVFYGWIISMNVV